MLVFKILNKQYNIFADFRLYLDGSVLPNKTMLSTDHIGRTLATALWCQSSRNETNIGTWLLPNGTVIPTTPTGQLYTKREQGQVGLLRTSHSDSFQGVYRCVILNDDNTNQSLLVWIYRRDVFYREGMFLV